MNGYASVHVSNIGLRRHLFDCHYMVLTALSQKLKAKFVQQVWSIIWPDIQCQFNICPTSLKHILTRHPMSIQYLSNKFEAYFD